MDDPKMLEIANKYGKSPAQVCVRFQVQRGVSVIPKSVTPARIKSNFEVSLSVKILPCFIQTCRLSKAVSS